MPPLRVVVKGPVLEAAIERSGHTVEQLAQRSGLAKLPEWIAESLEPTLRQLETLASATVTPLGYLLLDTQIHDPLPIPHFRTRNLETADTTDPDLLTTVFTLQKRQDWLRDYFLDKGQDPIAAVGTASPSDPSISVATRLHEFLATRPGWTEAYSTWEQTLIALKEAIEAQGVFLVVNGVVGNNNHRSLLGKPFSGFSLIDEYAPFIFLNATEAKSAQMFTLAHETAHLLFGSSAACAFSELQAADHVVEQACDRAAAEYLVPYDAMTRDWPQNEDLHESTRLLARRFKVSPIVVARRALDLDLVARESYSEFFEDYRLRAYRERSETSNGGNFYYNQNSRLGKSYARHIVTAVKSGELLYRDAYSLTDLYGSTFDTYAGYVSGDSLP